MTDAKLLTLAVAQALLGVRSEARWLRLIPAALSGAFPYLPGQTGYNKRLRSALRLLKRPIRALAADTDLVAPTPPGSGQVGCGVGVLRAPRRTGVPPRGWAGSIMCPPRATGPAAPGADPVVLAAEWDTVARLMQDAPRLRFGTARLNRRAAGGDRPGRQAPDDAHAVAGGPSVTCRGRCGDQSPGPRTATTRSASAGAMVRA